MSNVLTKFLVGIGWDTTEYDKGSRNIERSLDNVKGTALKTSAALIGAFGGVAASVVNTSHQVDQLALKTGKFNTGTEFVYRFGNALKLLGGNADEALTAVSGIEEMLTKLRLSGDAGALAELPKAGVDISGLLRSQSADEFLSLLSEQLPGLDKQQRQFVQGQLGLSDAAMKSLSGGSQEFDALLQRATDLTGSLEGLTENSRILQEQLTELGLRLDGVSNELAEKFLPSIIGATTWFSKLIDENRDKISGVIDYATENPGVTSAAVGSAGASVAGGILAKLGLSSLGGVISKAGTFGLAASGASVAADVTNRALDENVPGYADTSRSFDQFLMRLTGVNRIVSPRELFFGTSADGTAQSGAGTDEPLVDPMMYTPVSDQYRNEGQDADAVVKAIQAAKLNVKNDVNLTVELDGRALESKITEVNERTAYDTVSDVSTTTAR